MKHKIPINHLSHLYKEILEKNKAFCGFSFINRFFIGKLKTIIKMQPDILFHTKIKI